MFSLYLIDDFFSRYESVIVSAAYPTGVSDTPNPWIEHMRHPFVAVRTRHWLSLCVTRPMHQENKVILLAIEEQRIFHNFPAIDAADQRHTAVLPLSMSE